LIFTFASKVSNVTLNPPQKTFKLWQFDPFGLFIPKMPPYKKKKKKTKQNKKPKKPKKKKKKLTIYAMVAEPPHKGWPATPFGLGMVWPPPGRV
jgi:hypothetical protein